MRFAAILFDLDDTLMPEHAADRAAVRAVVASLPDELKLDGDALFDRVHVTARDQLRASRYSGHALEVGLSAVEALWSPSDPFDGVLDGFSDWMPAFRIAAWREALTGFGAESWAEEISNRYAPERDLHNTPFPETHGVLAELQLQRPLGLVTNGAPAVQRRKADVANLTTYFHTVVVSGDVKSRKPQAIVFERALEMLDAEASEVVMIGDRLNTDIEGAKALGMTAILVKRSGALPDVTGAAFAPDKIVSDLTGLSEVLGTL